MLQLSAKRYFSSLLLHAAFLMNYIDDRITFFWWVFFLFVCFFATLRVVCRILVPQLGIKPMLPAVEVQILNHWMSREVPQITFSQLAISVSHT